MTLNLDETISAMQLFLFVLASILLLSTLIPLSRNGRWWIRVLDFPRLQLLFFAGIVLLLGINYLDGQARIAISVAATFCLIYHLYWIYPYTALARVEVDSSHSQSQSQSQSKSTAISILTANVLMTNKDSSGLIRMVEREKPDILLTLETDKWWEKELAPIEGSYPHSVKCPLDNLYGMHLYSKFPLRESTVEYLVEEGVPSIHAEIELTKQQRVRAHFVHPYPPVPEYSESSNERDAELIVIAKSIQKCSSPTIVAGDLNDVAWSETTRLFRKISGLLDPRVGRGMFNTFNAKYWFLRWPLDHLFHSDHFLLMDLRRLEKFGSDHFAYYTKLVMKEIEPARKEGISASEADEEFAADKIDSQETEVEDVPFDEESR